MPKKKYGDLFLLFRIFSEGRRYGWHIAGILALSFSAAPLALLTPIPLKIAVDHILSDQVLRGFTSLIIPEFVLDSKTDLLFYTIALLIAINLFTYLQGLFHWILQAFTGEKLVLNFRSLLFRHAQRLSLSYHDRKGTADSIYRIETDASAIENIIIHGVLPLAGSAVTLIAMIYVMLRIDLFLALVALAIAPVLFILTQVYRRKLRDSWDEVKEHQTSALSVIHEVLSAFRVVKAYGQEKKEHDRYYEQAHRGVKGKVHVAFLGGGFDLLVGLVLALGTAAVLGFGVLHVQKGILTLGELLVVMAYLTQLYMPLETMSKNITTLQSSFSSAQRAFDLLDETPDVEEKSDAQPLKRCKGHITFKNVSFGYQNDRTVLKNVKIEVKPGMRVGIAGKTGSGKTTLVSLLMRFYDPMEGQIALDGLNLKDYVLADLRRQYAFVLQDSVLFSTSILENIAYARPDAAHEEIIEAAKAAHAHEFIGRLSQGYETEVGERGMALSGGERQRIALARAFLKNAPILILDEPTSAVDRHTEELILEALERLMENKTVFIISHRLDALSSCQLRLQMENGALREVQRADVMA